jgi:hypothetical protein
VAISCQNIAKVYQDERNCTPFNIKMFLLNDFLVNKALEWFTRAKNNINELQGASSDVN